MYYLCEKDTTLVAGDYTDVCSIETLSFIFRVKWNFILKKVLKTKEHYIYCKALHSKYLIQGEAKVGLQFFI